MWLFLNNGFFSIVAPTANDPALLKLPADKRRGAYLNDSLLVRARRKGDIERVFRVEASEVVESPNRDYRYRTILPRADVAASIEIELRYLSYTNFKNSIRDRDYHDTCARVWGVMDAYQTRHAPKRKPAQDDFRFRYGDDSLDDDPRTQGRHDDGDQSGTHQGSRHKDNPRKGRGR